MPKTQKQIKYKINYAADIVLVTGDREWDDRQEIYDWLEKFSGIKLLLQGSARGADLLSEDWARSREVPYLGVPAEWATKGKAAGPIRNAAMLHWLKIISEGIFKIDMMPEELLSGNKVQVLAFHENIKKSKGTADMMKKANAAGYNVYLVDKNDENS
jgi:hypothetical protein